MSALADKIAALRSIAPAQDTAPKPSLLDRIPKANVRPHDWQFAPVAPRNVLGRARVPITASDDLQRVLALPRRAPVDLDDPDNPTSLALVDLLSERLGYANPKCQCHTLGRQCITKLNPAQAWALYEMALVGGLLGPLSVGAGKTALNILAPMVLPGVKLAVLLVPPNLVAQLVREYDLWSQHFRVPSIVFDSGTKGRLYTGRPALHVVPYSRFSRPESTALLESLRPDLIIADEAHSLRYSTATRTRRLLRYFAAHPDTRLCCWSGTLTTKSVKDYAHLSALSLREASPLPLDPAVVEEWSLALDPLDVPAPAGALLDLCKPGEPLQVAYYRRLVETRGVVATKAGSVGASILIHERVPPAMPAALTQMLALLRKTATRPDGEELVDALQVARSARELACGFFYRWKYPRGEPEELITKWLGARKNWHKELREQLQHPAEHLDSPLLCARAAIRAYQHCEPPLGRGVPYEGDLPVWPAKAWPEWHEVRESVQPESEAVWVDQTGHAGVAPIAGADYLVRDAAAWAKEHRGIVWYEHDAFGRRVAELAGLPLHAGGPDAEAKILAEKGDRSLVVSIKAHGTGRDGLQRLFSKQLIANPPGSGGAFEQLLGRLHRLGQPADEVETWVYRHTPEMRDAIDRAVQQARYIEGTMGTLQKLLAATCTFDV